MTVDSIASDRGGPSRSVPALCVALAAEGVTMHLVVHRNDSGRPAGIPVESRFAAPTSRLRVSSRAPAYSLNRVLRSTVRDVDARFLHDNGAWLISNHVAATVSARLKIPRVVSPRGMLEPWSMRQSHWKKTIAWNLYQERDLRSASIFHATSESEALSIRGLGFAQPIGIIPNGVSIPSSLPAVERQSAKRTALFLSRLHPKKGILDLIEAWARVRPVNWKLQIAGHDDGGHQRDIEHAVVRNHLSDAVSITGGVTDAEKWNTYRGADLFILPTKSENFGIVIAEALACELPVITTRGAPWQDLLRYQCGWWVDLSVEALASAIEDATAAPISALREMGKRGRLLVEKELSWARAAREMRQLYEWAIHQGPRPTFVVT